MPRIPQAGLHRGLLHHHEHTPLDFPELPGLHTPGLHLHGAPWARFRPRRVFFGGFLQELPEYNFPYIFLRVPYTVSYRIKEPQRPPMEGAFFF